MMKKRKVVVTGLGVVSPIGVGVADFWKSVKEGKNGIGSITQCEVLDGRAKLAAEIKDFNLLDYIDVRNVRRMERFTQFAVLAADEAIRDSGFDIEKEDKYRVGTAVSSGIGSLQGVERSTLGLKERGSHGINPLIIPLIIPNMAAANISIRHKLMGKSLNISTACASGNNSIGEAFRTIQCGDADIMVAGGAEAAIASTAVHGFAALSALSQASDPNRASIPFDKERAGFIMGEGAGVAVLEEEEHARKRGARIYAEMLGYGFSSDAYHITAPSEDSLSQAQCMASAIKDAGLKPSDIVYVNAHGTGTKYNDMYETKAIKICFGEHASKLKINSTKSMTGHLLGAAGGLEFVVLCKSVEEGFIHKTINLNVPDPACDLDYVAKEPVVTDVRYAMSNGFGFGGHNTTLVIGKSPA